MCGRYAFFASPQKLKDLFGVGNTIALIPRYNSAPMQELPIIVRGRLGLARWGLTGAGTINARSETVEDRPAFRDAWAQGRRCLVPASGYYEWKDGRQAYFIQGADDCLAFAGLWSRQEGRVTFTILTRPAVRAVAALHARMPVIVRPVDAARWFGNPDDAQAMIAASNGNGLRFHPVSPDVGKVSNDNPSLIEPWLADTAPFALTGN